jgi:hypothetical protein
MNRPGLELKGHANSSEKWRHWLDRLWSLNHFCMDVLTKINTGRWGFFAGIDPAVSNCEWVTGRVQCLEVD